MIVLNSPAHRCRAVLALVALTSLTSACSSGPREELDGRRAATEPTPVESRRAVVEKEGQPPAGRRVPGDAEEMVQGSGEVPPQLLAIFQDDLARRALVKHEAITVVSATEQQWPNGAMGCPQPGQMYTQALIPGYRVVLKAGEDKYAYHSDRRGNFIVCSAGVPFPAVKEQMKEPRPIK
jgi:hypothetical protein